MNLIPHSSQQAYAPRRDSPVEEYSRSNTGDSSGKNSIDEQHSYKLPKGSVENYLTPCSQESFKTVIERTESAFATIEQQILPYCAAKMSDTELAISLAKTQYPNTKIIDPKLLNDNLEIIIHQLNELFTSYALPTFDIYRPKDSLLRKVNLPRTNSAELLSAPSRVVFNPKLETCERIKNLCDQFNITVVTLKNEKDFTQIVKKLEEVKKIHEITKKLVGEIHSLLKDSPVLPLNVIELNDSVIKIRCPFSESSKEATVWSGLETKINKILNPLLLDLNPENKSISKADESVLKNLCKKKYKECHEKLEAAKNELKEAQAVLAKAKKTELAHRNKSKKIVSPESVEKEKLLKKSIEAAEEYLDRKNTAFIHAEQNFLEGYRAALLEIIQSMANPASQVGIDPPEHLHPLLKALDKAINKDHSIDRADRKTVCQNILQTLSKELRKYLENLEPKILEKNNYLVLKWINDPQNLTDYRYLYNQQLDDHWDYLDSIHKKEREVKSEWDRAFESSYFDICYEENGEMKVLDLPKIPKGVSKERQDALVSQKLNMLETAVSKYTFGDKTGTVLKNFKIRAITILEEIEKEQSINEERPQAIELMDTSAAKAPEKPNEGPLGDHRRLFDFFSPLMAKPMEELIADPKIMAIIERLQNELTGDNPDVMKNFHVADIARSVLKFHRSLLPVFTQGITTALKATYTHLYPDNQLFLQTFSEWDLDKQIFVNITLDKETSFQWLKKTKLRLKQAEKNQTDPKIIDVGHINQRITIKVPPVGSKEKHGKISISLLFEKLPNMTVEQEEIVKEYLRKATMVLKILNFPPESFLTGNFEDNAAP